MKIRMKQWADRIRTAPERVAVPIMTTPGIELIGARPGEVFQSGELQARAILALNAEIPAAAAVTMMDLSVEAEAFGSPIGFSEYENPTVTARLLSDPEEIPALAVPPVGAARTGETLKCVRLCAEKLTDRPLLGGMIGPFSLAGRLYDMTEMMMLAALEPEAAHALLRKATDFLLPYARAFREAGANGLVVAEPAAGLLSPEMSAEFAASYVRELVEAVQDDEFLVVLHNCGNIVGQIPDWLATGAGAIHVGNAVRMTEVWPQIPPDVLIMGNISPVDEFKNGTPESMTRAVFELLEAGRPYPNFVLSSGCDIPPGTPMTNVRAFFAALAEFNRRG